MERTSFADMRCSLARTLERMGDWWSPLILRDLYLGLSRFEELAEDLGISRNLLARRLKLLVANGLVVRHAYSRKPPRYEYRLSEAGLDLVPALLALTAWGDRWAAPAEGRPILFRHAGCGHVFEPRVTCSRCGGTLAAGEVEPQGGPGGGDEPGTRVVARRLAKRAGIG